MCFIFCVSLPPPTYQGTRRLDPLVKAASDASDLADRAWLLLAHAAAGSAAEGGIEAKKLLETTQAQAAQDPRRGALLLLQQARGLVTLSVVMYPS